MTVIRSVSDDQNEILDAIQTLHIPEGIQCDLTYGNGAFYKNRQTPPFKFDLTPLQDGVVQADSGSVPIEDASLQSIMFDPPFLTYVSGAREHNSVMSKRFGGYYTYDDLEEHYERTLKECKRLLKYKGVLVFKCQDIIHNHRMHCTHEMVIRRAREHGLRLLDLFILTAKHRMPSPQKGTQRHARIFHTYFLVFTRMKDRP